MTQSFHEQLVDRVCAEAGELPIVGLSDFDHTLSHEYLFDETTNDHYPHIDPAVLDAAADLDLVVATGRRANSESLLTIWRSGLIHSSVPIIAENGGTLVSYDGTTTSIEDLTLGNIKAQLALVKKEVETDEAFSVAGHKLVAKLGRTILIVRLQDENGATNPDLQELLLTRIHDRITADTDLAPVNNRVSVAVQPHGTNKATAFRSYLEAKGMKRKDVYVVGMGDGLNDQPIFDEANLSIGFGDEVQAHVDVALPDGLDSTLIALQALQAVKKSQGPTE